MNYFWSLILVFYFYIVHGVLSGKGSELRARGFRPILRFGVRGFVQPRVCSRLLRAPYS